jgi:hypothetical protein
LEKDIPVSIDTKIENLLDDINSIWDNGFRDQYELNTAKNMVKMFINSLEVGKDIH